MRSRLIQAWLGVAWISAGALIAFNAPPPDSRRYHLPAVGVVVLVGGIYFAAKALFSRAVKESGEAPRHADTASTVRDALKLALIGTVGAIAGVGDLWWYLRSGLLSVLGLAIAALGLMIPVLALALAQLWAARRSSKG